MTTSLRGVRRAHVLLLAPVLTAVVALTAIGVTGGLSGQVVDGLPDPGILTRVGLPTVQTLRDLAAIATVGVLVVASTCVPPPTVGQEHVLGPARRRLVVFAQLTATVWATASLALAAFVYSDASGEALTAPGFAREAVFFAFGFEVGQYALWGALLSALVATG